MAGQSASHDLSPQLRTVLSSLSVNLEAELNRYRRNRRLNTTTAADLFADLEDPSFDLDAIGNAVEASIASTVALARPQVPPPPPRNKKLLPSLAAEDTARVESLALSPSTASESSLTTISPADSDQQMRSLAPYTALAEPLVQSSVDSPQDSTHRADTEAKTVSTSYLASSEKLIESLVDVPPMPEPVDIDSKPKRKTVSLLAGATLGFLGLIAGLGASYLMANPLVTQRLVSGFQSNDSESMTESASTFDPPGPDLSANEFVDLKIDNLSSLRMPPAAITPDAIALSDPLDPAAATQPGPAADPALPPIQAPATTNNPPTLPLPVETQAVIVPVGLTYYVTAPFTTEQGLMTIRETVSEAFVRRFSDGNRIQMAAFDNPQAAQAYISELQAQGITAQVYGPTTE